MKKLFLLLSLILNVILFVVCIYQMSRPKKKVYIDNSAITYFSLQQEMPINNGDIIFMGGKQVVDCDWHEYLGDCRIKNRGLPGARINNEFLRLDLILENGPAQIFLLFGIDDLNAGTPPETVLEQYKNLVDNILAKSPMTEIIIQSILPVDPEQKRILVDNKVIEELNTELKEYALSNGIVYLNLYDDFLDETGNLSLHYSLGDGYLLSASGYNMWRERINPFLRR